MPLILNGTTGISGIDGSAGTPSYQGTDSNTGIFYPAADTIAFAEGGTEVMRIDSSGNVGIGTTSPTNNGGWTTLSVNGASNGGIYEILKNGTRTFLMYNPSGSSDTYLQATTGNALRFGTDGNERMRIDSSGNVGIGTTSPNGRLEIVSTSAGANTDTLFLTNANSSASTSTSLIFGVSTAPTIRNATIRGINKGGNAIDLAFLTSNGDVPAERMRITSGGVLVINSSAPETTISGGTPIFQVTGSGFNSIGAFTRRQNDANGPALCLTKSRNTSANSYTVVQNGDTLGAIIFLGDDGTDLDTYGAVISAQVDGTPGANDMPGRLVFSTTADGAATVTERMRIDSSGNVGIGTTTPGAPLQARGQNILSASTRYLKGWIGGAGSWGADAYEELGIGYSGIRSLYTSGDNWNLTFATGTSTQFAAGTQSERMRIHSNGYITMGTTNTNIDAGPGFKFIATTNAYIGMVVESSINSQTNYHLYSTGAGTYRFYVGAGGTIYATATTIVAISDVRLKENIQDIDVGLDAIMALKPRKFDWKEGKGKDKKGDRGWIAQEFEQVFPDMIENWKDPAPEGEEPYKAVSADLIPVLVKAIQEQQAMIEELKQEVASLKGA